MTLWLVCLLAGKVCDLTGVTVLSMFVNEDSHERIIVLLSFVPSVAVAICLSSVVMLFGQ